jgi:predicted TIM-barrel fold metal-dependent hydrolase
VTNAGTWGKRYEDNDWYGWTYDNIRQGAFVGKERLAEQDIDGVGTFMAQEDDDYHLAGLEAYNAWMATEFAVADPDRLVGLAQMPATDVATAVRWLRDAKRAGFRGVIVSAYPSGGAALSTDDDPFWAAAEEEQLPVHIHSGLAHAGRRGARPGTALQSATASFSALPGLQQMGGAVAGASQWMSEFIYSGLFDRFPGLQIAAVECGAGWVPHFLEHMDDHWWRNRVWTDSHLKLLPSEYFRRNWKVTFIREPFAVQTRHWIGVANMMFSPITRIIATTGPTRAASSRSHSLVSPSSRSGR